MKTPGIAAFAVRLLSSGRAQPGAYRSALGEPPAPRAAKNMDEAGSGSSGPSGQPAGIEHSYCSARFASLRQL